MRILHVVIIVINIIYNKITLKGVKTLVKMGLRQRMVPGDAGPVTEITGQQSGLVLEDLPPQAQGGLGNLH
jgi:hypothetical protein